jgi:4-hydroxy-4-methyl-2-oxoglutarate aldolase
MAPQLMPLSHGMKLCGPAVTVLGPDRAVRLMAINLAQPNDVIVIAAGGAEDRALFGDNLARNMKLKGLAGVVIDGAARDASAVRHMGFPTFVKSVTPRNYHYPQDAGYGAINVPVVCGGMLVSPGDLVMGDDDGVIVVPRAHADHMAGGILEEFGAEQEAHQTWTKFRPYDVEEQLRQCGYRFVD